MKECVEVLWDIRKDIREGTISSSPLTTTTHSATFPEGDAKKSLQISFGVEDKESYKFISA